MDSQEKLFKDGFNSGYFLAQHDPEFARRVLDAAMSPKEPSEYAFGLSNGHDTYIIEQIIAQNKEAAGEPSKKKQEEQQKSESKEDDNKSIARELPTIKFGNNDFTVDVQLEEFRETKAPWNRISMDDLYDDGSSYKFLYDQNTNNTYTEQADINSLPDHVKLITVPPLTELDPVGMARVMGLDDNAFLKKPEDEKAYTDGFNSGYLLSKHEPEIAAMLILPQENPSDYHQGLTAGKQEHELEKIQDRLSEISKNKPAKDNRELDKDR
jgi:hypothetical protein